MDMSCGYTTEAAPRFRRPPAPAPAVHLLRTPPPCFARSSRAPVTRSCAWTLRERIPPLELRCWGYDCTGRWNQLFNLGANCTIIAEQPAVVGRVRGNGGGSGDSGESVSLCLDVRHSSGVVVTAPCGHLASSAAEQSTVDVNNAGEAVDSSREDTNSKVKAASTDQQFQFITADGKSFQDYMQR